MAAVSETAVLPLHAYSKMFLLFFFFVTLNQGFSSCSAAGLLSRRQPDLSTVRRKPSPFVVVMITEWKPARRGKTGQKGESRSNGKIL